MGVFYLKYLDTRPILEVVLHDPPPIGSPPGTLGPVHDLSGSTAWYLHVWLNDGTKTTRPMVKFGADTDGTLRYAWVAGDWAVGAGGPPFTSGGLIIGPTLPLVPGTIEHRQEYEVVGPTDARLSFPNGGHDTLRVWSDIGQGAVP